MLQIFSQLKTHECPEVSFGASQSMQEYDWFLYYLNMLFQMRKISISHCL
jgi:hypothetical protein